MPTSFEVHSASGAYPVRIGAGLLDAAIATPGDRVFVVDSFLVDRFRVAGIDALSITADEEAKSLDRMAEVIVAMRQRGVTRATELVAVGGGVVQDICAFAASIYMRGLAWIYVPTTLLAMTDSCIGGKSSINVGTYKNIVGTFHPPAAVLVDPDLTETLSPEQRAAGLCEAAKIALCRGSDSFAAYLAFQPGVEASAATLQAVCNHALRAKQWFIESDEFDRGERLLLNFGHTFGHALEAASGFRISHGIAVGLGMLAALRSGELRGRDYTRIPHIAAFREHIESLVAAVHGVDEVLRSIDLAQALDAFGADKKHTRDSLAVIVVDTDGVVTREFLPRNEATLDLIGRAFASVLDRRLAAAPAR